MLPVADERVLNDFAKRGFLWMMLRMKNTNHFYHDKRLLWYLESDPIWATAVSLSQGTQNKDISRGIMFTS